MTKILVFDTETTGLPPKRTKLTKKNLSLFPYIVQLSYVVYDSEKNSFQEHDHIIKLPEGIPNNPDAVKIHGITDEIINEKGEDCESVFENFIGYMKECHTLVAHNINFDIRMLRVEFFRNGLLAQMQNMRNIHFCTMEHGINYTLIPFRVKNGHTEFKRPKLIELHEKLFNETPKNLHNALVDVYVCFRCFYFMSYRKDYFNDDNIKHKERFKELCGL
jgi:DNA polymerase-3 subunit alpha